VVNVYHHNRNDIEEEDINTELKLTRRRPSKTHHRKDSSGSKMLNSTEAKVG